MQIINSERVSSPPLTPINADTVAGAKRARSITPIFRKKVIQPLQWGARRDPNLGDNGPAAEEGTSGASTKTRLLEFSARGTLSFTDIVRAVLVSSGNFFINGRKEQKFFENITISITPLKQVRLVISLLVFCLI